MRIKKTGILLLFLIMAVIVISVFYNPSKTKKRATTKELQTIQQSIIDYKEKEGSFPPSISSIVNNRPLKKAWLTDAWNNPYHYNLLLGIGFNLISKGKDGKLNTADDIELEHLLE